jgi:glycolate oxidase
MICLPTPGAALVARRRDRARSRGLVREATHRRGRPAHGDETDALTAYRRRPLAVALPESTAEVAAILRYARARVKVVPRGAGFAVGRCDTAADAIVVGLGSSIEYSTSTTRTAASSRNPVSPTSR